MDFSLNSILKLCIAIIGHNDIAHLNRSLTTASDDAADHKDCHILYADDCSADGSADFARMLSKTRPNISVFESPFQRNIGGARNAAVEHLSSLPEGERPEYIWFHDSDDYLTKGSVARVLEAISKNNDPDCVSIPMVTWREGMTEFPKCAVVANNIDEAAYGPVSECAYAFKMSLYVKNPENQRCEDCPWHFEQFDKFGTWAKVEGDHPCYVWDNTNPNATTRTVDYCGCHSMTLLSAALDNPLIKDGKNDRWISDNLRNLANMYDVRLKLKKPSVFRAWESRFRTELSNFFNGFHIH